LSGGGLLDRLRRRSYIAACAVLAACHGRPAPLVPEPLAPLPVDSIVAWSRLSGPRRPVALRFHWKYRDDRRGGGGRGTARMAPPDSVRVDWATSLNIKTGAAVVLGDSLGWADPKEDFPASAAPAVQFVWIALGVVRPPRATAAVSGSRDSTRALWRYAEDRDTLDFRLGLVAPRTLEAEWRRAGRVLARGRTLLGPAGLSQSVRIDVPERSARFELTVVGVDSAAIFAPALWRSRR
jgi:hypothetical protein